jgi:hypothetical protein
MKTNYLTSKCGPMWYGWPSISYRLHPPVGRLPLVTNYGGRPRPATANSGRPINDGITLVVVHPTQIASPSWPAGVTITNGDGRPRSTHCKFRQADPWWEITLVAVHPIQIASPSWPTGVTVINRDGWPRPTGCKFRMAHLWWQIILIAVYYRQAVAQCQPVRI